MALLPLARIKAGGAATDIREAGEESAAGVLSKADFNLGGRTYINAASVHPMSIHAAVAMRNYVDGRAGLLSRQHREQDPRVQFAKLINAKPEEVAVIPSTSMGENYVINGIGLRGSRFDMMRLPYDPVSAGENGWTQKQGARGYYEVGTEPYAVLSAVQVSLDRILAMGVDEIARRRQPLIDFVRAQLPEHGFEPLAPPSNSALACFAYPDAGKVLVPKLRKANISISVYQHRIRISPSVYNDMNDMAHLVDVLTS